MLQDSGKKAEKAPCLDPSKPTAVFMIGEMDATGMSMYLWVQKNFTDIFSNFLFVSVGEIDTEELGDLDKLTRLRHDNKRTLKQYVNFCQSQGIASGFYHSYGTDVVDKMSELTDTISREYRDVIFFSTKLISDNDNFMTQILHNETAYIMQRRLHNRGRTLIIIPMKF